MIACLVATTGAKSWIHESARENRADFGAWLLPTQNRPDSAGVVTFYAIGDQGYAGEQQAAVAELLKINVGAIGAREVRPFVLGTGDNYYPNGLPWGWPKDHVPGLFLDRRFDEVYAACLHDGHGLTFHLVHGNHDYRGDVYLWETFAEGRFDGSDGTPRLVSYTLRSPNVADTNNETEYDGLRQAAENGELLSLPELVPVPTDKVAIIAIDSYVMIHLQDDARGHKDDDGPNEAAEKLEAHWAGLRLLLAENADVRWAFVVGHHPIATHGAHGGHNPRPLGLHLHGLWKKIRGVVGAHDIQDLGHSAYDAFADRLATELAVRKRVVYVAGHEHNLQMLWYKDRLIQIVSGAGSKLTSVKQGRDTVFKAKEPGLVRFDVAGNDLWVEFIYGSSATQRKSSTFRINRR